MLFCVAFLGNPLSISYPLFSLRKHFLQPSAVLAWMVERPRRPHHCPATSTALGSFVMDQLIDPWPRVGTGVFLDCDHSGFGAQQDRSRKIATARAAIKMASLILCLCAQVPCFVCTRGKLIVCMQVCWSLWLQQMAQLSTFGHFASGIINISSYYNLFEASRFSLIIFGRETSRF